ncbi:hypothetical protein E3N88_40836 [Mikania micrantha]|uniref:Uncharacterized protein n=1 Tax=Mikania micrantha TaxID=192012 RepID=A0A5N6LNU5_9ASTR|nr:hypothetical protein E3N88_40836 [Mikania micrantha]
MDSSSIAAALIGFIFMALFDVNRAQEFAPSPAPFPANDGATIDQGIAYYWYKVIDFTTVQSWHYKIKSYNLMLGCMGKDILELGFPDVTLDVTIECGVRMKMAEGDSYSADGRMEFSRMRLVPGE